MDDALNRIYVAASRRSKLWVFDADIAGCFDNIAHEPLIKKLEGFPAKDIIWKWLKAGVMVDGVFEESTGTPQGGILSPLLCNIALDGMQSEIKIKDRKESKDRTFVRYADDFVVLCTSYEDAVHVKELVKEALKNRGLELSEKKCRISHLIEGFDFLGFTIRVEPFLILKDGYNLKDIAIPYIINENTIFFL